MTVPADLDLCDLCFPQLMEPGEWVCSTCEVVPCTYEPKRLGDFSHSVGYYMCSNHQYSQQVGRFKAAGLGWPRA